MKKFRCPFENRPHWRFLFCTCLLLMGCGATQTIPDWIATSHNQLERYRHNYLSGREEIAAVQFKSAVTEIKKSGDLQLLARAYLTQMALHTATLEALEDQEYRRIEKANPDSRNSNYYNFLQGNMAHVDATFLPPQYKGICQRIKTGADGYMQEISKIKDPLSQLIITGILVRLDQDNEDVLKLAITVASGQGWKKALLVYLERLKLAYEKKKEPAKAIAIEQRIKLISE